MNKNFSMLLMAILLWTGCWYLVDRPDELTLFWYGTFFLTFVPSLLFFKYTVDTYEPGI